MKILFIVLLMFATTGVAEMKLYQKLNTLHTVALITVNSEKGSGTGSGVVVASGEGYSLILTVNHVVKGAKAGDLFVTLYPSEVTVPAYIVKKSSKYDLALLKIDVYHEHVARRISPEVLPPFTDLWKMGAGNGETPFPTHGVIEEFEADTGLMHISAPIIFGDSGGGIFLNSTGELIGVVVGTAVTGYKGHPVVVSFMGLCYNIYAINDFLSSQD